MILSTILTGVLLATASPPPPAGDLLAIRVGRAETVSHGAIEHAVILVEKGKIVAVGEDLPVQRGIPTLDRPDWVVLPGLVNCYSRVGMDSQAGRDFEPEIHASAELYPRQDIYREVLEAGVTTLGLYPPGTGVPGQAVAIRPRGDTSEAMILADPVYLKIYLESNATSTKTLRDAFAKVDEYDEKVKKEKEKWEKEQEKKKKPKKEDEGKEKEQEQGQTAEKKDKAPSVFTPPEPDPKVLPFLQLRQKKLRALMRIQKAADYDHLLDVIEKEDIDWMVRCPLRDDIDFFHVEDKIGERKLIAVLDPEITLQPSTRRERNIPAEFARAGARLVLVPRRDDARGHELWLKHVGELIAAGLARDVALSAVTLEAANVLGLGERLGSIDPGKDANLVFWNGDPFEAGTEVQAVMLEGEFVHGEVGQ
ncbi:MAG: amidohydrolase family protein [Planctomycetota bacterium]